MAQGWAGNCVLNSSSCGVHRSQLVGKGEMGVCDPERAWGPCGTWLFPAPTESRYGSGRVLCQARQ